jgi:hypothetical protein
MSIRAMDKDKHMRIARVFIPLLLALVPASVPSMSSAQIAIGVSITIAPPELPDYDQPPIPAPGYIWTPGYWAYGDDGYYWVPGTWIEPPEVGLLWTPGYWDWSDGVYVFHDGYWGPHVGFYGGVCYGFGYGGVGYEGGYWERGAFRYNTVVNNFGGVHITNVYNKTIINNTTIIKVSFHGGASGTKAQATPAEREAEHEHHHAPTAMQTHHRDAARSNRALLASVNHGRPAIAATAKPGEFSGHGVVAARETKGPVGGPAADHGHAGPGPDHMHDTHKGPPPGGPAHGQTASAPPNAPHPMDARRQAHPVEAKAPPHPPAPHPVRAAARPPAPHPVRAAAPRPHPAPHPVARAAPKKGKHG